MLARASGTQYQQETIEFDGDKAMNKFRWVLLAFAWTAIVTTAGASLYSPGFSKLVISARLSANDIAQPTQTNQQSGEAGSLLKRLSAKIPDAPTFIDTETLELMQQVAKIKSPDAAKLLIKCLAFNYNPENQDEDRSEDMMIPAIKLLKEYFGESAAPLLYEEGLSTSKGWFRDRIALAVRTIVPESGVENFKKKALADVALRPAAFEFHQSLSSEHLDLRLNAPHDRRNAEIERSIEEVKKKNQGGKPR